MADKPTPVYITATVVATVLGAAGVWLPWVRKRPVGYRNGQPIYTMEYVSGLEAGLRGIDPFVILLVVAVVVVVALARYRNWRPDIALIGAGGLLLVVFGNIFHSYWSVERYAVESGLYLLLFSGLLYVLVGAGAILKRRVTTSPDDGSDARIG